MAEKIEVGVTIKGTEKVSTDLNKIDSKTQDISGSVDMASGSLDRMTGGMLTMVKGVVGGAKKAVIGMKTLRGAIMSTGIGLLVVAVGALAAAFTSSEEGQNKFAKMMAVIGSLTDNLIDLFADLGEGIIKAFEDPMPALESAGNMLQDNFTNRLIGLVEFIPSVGKAIKQAFDLEFTEAAKTATDAMAKMMLGIEGISGKAEAAAEKTQAYLDQVAEEMRLAGLVADERAKAAILDRELLVDRSKIEAKIASLRLKSRQEEEFSAEQRKTALVDAQALEEQLLNKEIKSLQLKADAQTLENTFARSNIENLDKEASAIAAVNNIQTTRLNAQKSTQRELNRLNKEIEADNKQKEKDAATSAATLKAAIQSDAQNEIDVVTAKYIALNELAVGNAEAKAKLKDKEEADLLAITKKYAEEEVVVIDTAGAKKKALEESTAKAVKAARLGIVSAGFDAFKAMAKTEEGQKRLAIAQILVNQGIAMSAAIRTALTAAAAMPQPAGMFSVPGFTASMIGMVLSSFASIKGVMNQAGAASGSVGTSSGGGGSGGGTAQLALTPSLESFGEGTLALPAVQAYILQNNIADADALAQALQNQSSL